MSKKFQNKYRITSARLQNWDYSSNAAYFITICCANRKHFFGEIENKQMYLSKIGEIAQNEWLKTPEIRPDMNLTLDTFVIMPNHFHAIIVIGENIYNSGDDINETNDDNDTMHRRDTMHCVSTNNVSTNHVSTIMTTTNSTPKNQFGPQRKNLASIMRGFKSAVTKNARQINPGFGWQPGFHDHIIKSDNDYHRIAKYIENNPGNWKNDKFYRD